MRSGCIADFFDVANLLLILLLLGGCLLPLLLIFWNWLAGSSGVHSDLLLLDVGLMLQKGRVFLGLGTILDVFLIRII